MLSFEEHLNAALRAAMPAGRELSAPGCQPRGNLGCGGCLAGSLPYDDEVALKQNALGAFWKDLRIGIPLDSLVTAGSGRRYRTVSKRKLFHTRTGPALGLISPAGQGGHRPVRVEQCAIEPVLHGRLFQTVEAALMKPYAVPLASVLRYVIVRGTERESALILSCTTMAPEVVRAANTLSRTVTRKHPAITSVFLYEDASDGRYYLGTSSPEVRPRFKKLFGKGTLYQKVLGKGFIFSPLAFSQVNEAIVEPMVTIAGSLLTLTPRATLYDLYCGYGLFGLSLAERVGRVVGVEVSTEAVAAATANAGRQHAANARFVRSDISVEGITRVMQSACRDDLVLLDPPRGGTAEGVIEAIAAHAPAQALHIICNTAVIKREIDRWKEAGYKATRAVPFDMFPGTSAMEVMVLVEQ